MPIQKSLLQIRDTVSVKRIRDSSEQNFSVTSDGPNFSFKNKVKDLEFLDNPNLIEESDFRKLKNVKANLQNKFSETQDPIFDFDEQIPQPVSTQIAKTQNKINKKVSSVQKRAKRTSIRAKTGVTRYV